MKAKNRSKPFFSAQEEVKLSKTIPTVSTASNTYRIAFTDQEFLLRRELRPIRLQLELLKPELIMQEEKISSTIVIFGSARIHEEKIAKAKLLRLQKLLEKKPADKMLRQKVKTAESLLEKSKFYNEARKLAALVSKHCQTNCERDLVVVTGGGPGIMEAANRGAHDVKAKNIGLNIVLPMEQEPNKYISPELNFQFHYFAIRKMHFLIRAQALVAFPGGFGTLDELFEALTLLQTKKIEPIPVILFGKKFWDKIINFHALVDEGTISEEDLELFQYVETAEEAWNIIARFNKIEPCE